MNETLPIYPYQQEIVRAVRLHRVVVITAETGAGKSTQVPQYLLQAGFRMVVTQPRRLAARSLAERVAEEIGCELGSLVGYRTAAERLDSLATRILFATDGLQLIRELTNNQTAQLLVLDEVHEWNVNMEALIAWSKRRLAVEEQFKVIVMSATLDAERLAVFFGPDTPVVHVAGRQYPVDHDQRPTAELIPMVQQFVKAGRNVLVFQPGKQEIEQTIQQLAGLNAVVLPLHSELEPADQRLCFRHYERPKVVVATNIAQTSVTIDDITAVVDSGLERRMEQVDGIEGLYLHPISQADCDQRAGRAGRTAPGVYSLCSDVPRSGRPPFPTAEIELVRLDQLVLRLAAAELDATELEFFHQPDAAVFADAKRALLALGALDDQGAVTTLGWLMAKLPVAVRLAKMVIEAERRGVVDDVVTIAAILEAGGIRDRSGKWRSHVQGEVHSELIAELNLWKSAQQWPEQYLREFGVFEQNFIRAREIRERLVRALTNEVMQFGSSGERDEILRACLAGLVDHVYQAVAWRWYQNGNDRRRLPKESVILGSPPWVVGIPFDVEFPGPGGQRRVVRLLNFVSKVEPAWIAEVTPHILK